MTQKHFDALVQSDIERLCREAKQRYEAGVALPQGWPTYAEQREYWERQAQAPVNGENDWKYDEQQFSNYEEHQL